MTKGYFPVGMFVSIWQLADDVETYGESAGKFILVSPDAEHEISVEVFDTAEDAARYAVDSGWQVVELEFH